MQANSRRRERERERDNNNCWRERKKEVLCQLKRKKTVRLKCCCCRQVETMFRHQTCKTSRHIATFILHICLFLFTTINLEGMDKLHLKRHLMAISLINNKFKYRSHGCMVRNERNDQFSVHRK
jgi:hypothetical protein